MELVIFADDTNLFLTDKDKNQLRKNIKHDLSTLVEWFRSNQLSLNVKKTNYMLFSRHKEEINIDIEGIEIKRVDKTKFLGLILDDKLRWQDQMDVINNKVAKAIGILHAGRSKLNFDAKRTLYNTLVLPHLQYGAEIWGNATKTRLKRIKVKQKQAVRMIYKKNKRDHTGILFRRCNLL